MARSHPSWALSDDAILTDTYHYVSLDQVTGDFVLGHVMRGYGTMTDGFSGQSRCVECVLNIRATCAWVFGSHRRSGSNIFGTREWCGLWDPYSA